MAPHHPRARRAAGALLGALALAPLATHALGAQSVLRPTVRVAPGTMTYTITGEVRTTVTETVLPVAAVTALGPRLTLDLATAYVRAAASTRGAASSRIGGLTDTQLRVNYTLGGDAVVLTAGLNLPTGRYAVEERELDAAGMVGNDFLGFPVSSLGDGLAGTAGVAVARQLGAWSAGAGAAVRHGAAFDAFAVAAGTVRFRPADEYRLRVGADRPLGDGRVSAGLTYAMFGRDAAGPTTYGTGDRVVLQGSYTVPVADAELLVDAWSLYHAAGDAAGGRTPWENVASVAVAGRWQLGRTSLEPNAELRDWVRGGRGAGRMAIVGARGRVDGPLGTSLLPSVGIAMGRLPAEPSAALPAASVRGWQLSLAVRR